MNKISIEDCKSIANKLMTAPQLESLGLSGGMMGQCLFYYWMHRKTHIEEYERAAEKMLDHIVENISFRSFVFEDGITGIGWSVNHLVHYKFVSGEVDEIFEEVDRHVRLFLSKTHNFNLELVAGLGLYFINRYPNEKSHEVTPVQKRIEHDLLTLLLLFNFFIERANSEVFFKYAKELNSSVTANNPLIRSFYFLIQCYKSNLFNYRVAKLIRYLLRILIDCKEQTASQNREYLCLLINDLKNSFIVRKNDITYLISDYCNLEKNSEFATYKNSPEFFADESTVYLFTDNIFIPLISIK